MQRMNSIVLALAWIFVLFIGSSNSYKVRLERKDDSDHGEHWKSITCRYIEGHEDYNAATGCLVNLYPLGEEYFQPTAEETWGVCSRKTCDFVYYNVALQKAPKNVTVKAIVAGDGKISISGKTSFATPTLTLIDTIKPQTPSEPRFEVWTTRAVDLGENNFVISISLDVPDVNSFALIDSIELDFGDDVTGPTTTTTTPAPPKFIFEADTNADLSKEFTEVSCNYVEHIDESWMWGVDCRKNATEKADTIGYWTACYVPSCHFIFDAGSAPLSELQLEGIFMKGASVRISKKSPGFGAAYRELLMMELDKDEESLTFDLEECGGGGKYNISINGAKGLALIDRLQISLSEDDSLPCPTEETPGSTTPVTSSYSEKTTGSGDDDDGRDGSSTPDDDNSPTPTQVTSGSSKKTTDSGGDDATTPDAGSVIASSGFTCAIAVLTIYQVFSV